VGARTAGSGATSRASSGEFSGGDRRSTDLLRESHIFGAVVREVLETSLLRDATPLPLSVSQFRLVKLMALNGHHQVGDVAEYLGVSSPAATKCIDKLERLGLVVRSPSEGDRRATWLAVSARGRRVVRQYEALKAARLANVLGEYPPAELRRLTRLLQRFSVSLLRTGRLGNRGCLRCAAYIAAPCPVGDVLGGCPYLTTHDARRSARARVAAAR
jgi:DNA-binding MarR family transcriptional regulator